MRIVAAVDPAHHPERMLAVIGPWAATHDVEVDVVSVLDFRHVHPTFQSRIFKETTPQGTWTGISIPSLETYPSVVEDRGAALERERQEIRERPQDAIAKALPEVLASAHVELGDDTADVICRFAIERGAAAIAVGTRIRPAVRAALFGSISEALVRRSPVPVLVIREDMASSMDPASAAVEMGPKER